jgi:protein TonB
MALRCLLFSSDVRTAEPIRQVLAGLGVEAEYCTEGVAAVEQATHKNFQIVIIDWDNQPEAGLLLTTARERKAAERPLTLAIVSDELSVPQALQAGANSILRKPILVNQVNDTLTTARDLLRAKQESAAAAAQAAAAGVSGGGSATSAASAAQGEDKPVRAGEFLESSPSLRRAQIVPPSRTPEFGSALAPIDSAKDSEPVAAPEAAEKLARSAPAPVSPLPPGGARGLEWYLKTRLGTSIATPIPERAPAPAARANPELLGFDQTPSPPSESAQPKSAEVVRAVIREPKSNEHGNQDRKKEAELFAYMAGDAGDSAPVPRPKSRLGKGAITGALVLAGCAILAAPQAPWHSNMLRMWARGRQSMHGWLYPQSVTPVQAPVAHEDFGRAGDEYKLPVGENIPDATTDPSQIQVVPVVDPTAKKPNNDATSTQQPTGPLDPSGATPSDQTPASGVQVPDKQLSPTPSETAPPASGQAAPATSPSPGSATAPTAVAPLRSDSPSTAPATSFSIPAAPLRSASPKNRAPRLASSPGNVPSSLKSQLASMTPDASGNKAPETAMPSIEPVVVPEAAERALLTEQAAFAYPANARGQQGTVILQVLIGRDGTVQDAKFLQGSLAFARAAIDGVKPWKFKPYTMNGRAVSVQTLLTLTFKPTP